MVLGMGFSLKMSASPGSRSGPAHFDIRIEVKLHRQDAKKSFTAKDAKDTKESFTAKDARDTGHPSTFHVGSPRSQARLIILFRYHCDHV
jgi:hypothetical protein